MTSKLTKKSPETPKPAPKRMTPAKARPIKTAKPLKAVQTPNPTVPKAPGKTKGARGIEPASPKPKRILKATMPRKTAPKLQAPRARAAGKQFSADDVALRAYFLSEKRRTLGLTGSDHEDWLEAERQIASERAYSKAKR